MIEMPSSLYAAAALAFLVGLAHSVLGEFLIFRHLRQGGLVPTAAAPPLEERNIRIIWASWHALTVFGWAFVHVLLRLASASEGVMLADLVKSTSIGAFLACSLLVLIGTRGRHPGWIGLLGVAALVWLS